MFESVGIEGLKLVTPKIHADERGFFSETHNASAWDRAGLRHHFVQDNHSLSADIGTVRGLHFQTGEFAQDKLVRVLSGRIVDVAVDLRRGAPTFGQHFMVELSKSNWRQLFIPIGFAHGFMTLEPNTEVLYKVTNFYSPIHEGGILWNDPDLAIPWPIPAERVLLSSKDRNLPRLRDLPELFA